MRARFFTACLLIVQSAAASAESSAALTHEGVVQAPIEKVWSAWTSSDGLRSWLAPHAEIDFRIGGTMRTNYSPDRGLDHPSTIENEILSYDPMRMISIRVSKAPAGFPFPNAIYEMWTVMYFEPVGAEQTRVRVVANGFTAGDESQRMRAFFDQGNAATVRQMQERIGSVGR